jgi:hypothetical protein
LAAAFLLTVASGLVGLFLTRTIPAQLARVGVELIYEKIPGLRLQVCQQAGELVLESVAASGATTLADFYTGRLYQFFHQPRGLWYFLRPTTALRRGLMREMQDTRRYLSDQEQPACERLFALVRRKDDLDFHEARQKLLKVWLFVHIALTYALVLISLLHGLMAHAFDGGAVCGSRRLIFPATITSGRTKRGYAAWRATAPHVRRARRCAASALPWPSVRRCARAIVGAAIARRCAAGCARKARRRRAVVAASIAANRCEVCAQFGGDSWRPARYSPQACC